VLVKSVRSLKGVVRYITNSPFLKANGRTNSFESDDHCLIQRIDAAMHINIPIAETARMRRYVASGSRSLSGPAESDAE
jgi:hypothetical protein